MAIDPARRAALQETRARALVAGLGVDCGLVAGSIPDAVTLRSSNGAGFVVFVAPAATATSPARAHDALGAALVWAVHAGVDSLTVLADDDAGVHARRADVLGSAPVVHQIRGTEVVPASPSALPPLVEIDPIVLAARPVLEAVGVDVVVEHGTMLGEVEGLEVARVVVVDGVARVEVGVGRYDQAASTVMHGDQPVERTLQRVAEQISRSRRVGRGDDAVGRLCRPRWLRSHLVAHPDLVGLDGLVPVEPPIPRAGLRHEMAAPALGLGPDGAEVVLVMATVGFDPGVVPLAADLVLRHDADRVVVALPPRDRHRIIEAIVGDLPGGVLQEVIAPWEPQTGPPAVD